MSKIVANGYIGVTAPDLDAWRELATGVLGATISPRSSSDRLLVRIDERAWRIAVEPGEGGLAYCGWEVADEASLEELGRDLADHEIEYRNDPELAERRGVSGLLVTEDPGGNQVEFFYGADVVREPFVSPTGVRFVTGLDAAGDMGFGHSVMTFPDLDLAKRFYFDILGFRLSDTITLDLGEHKMSLIFAHVNARHHSLAFVQGPPDTSVFDHFSLEVADLDMVGRALDEVEARGIPLHMTFGKHTNDYMLSFYLRTPSGFSIEYGTGGRLIGDGWLGVNYDDGSEWGHRFMGEMPG